MYVGARRLDSKILPETIADTGTTCLSPTVCMTHRYATTNTPEVLELAFTDAAHRILERKRLSRRALTHVLDKRLSSRVIKEACRSAHIGHGDATAEHTVHLLPARDMHP